MCQRDSPFDTSHQHRATKTAYLLRLTRMGRPCGSFLKTSKSSTCGFDFTIFRVVEGSRQNVVDSPISWRAIRSRQKAPSQISRATVKRKASRFPDENREAFLCPRALKLYALDATPRDDAAFQSPRQSAPAGWFHQAPRRSRQCCRPSRPSFP